MIIQDKLLQFSVVRADARFFYIEIRALKPGVCRNNWDFPMEGIEKCMETFRGQPILCAYKGMKIGDGHNTGTSFNPKNGQMEEDFRGADAERVVGYVPEDANIKIEEIEGEKWLVVSAVLFRFYNQQLVEDIIKKSYKSVSIEVLPTKKQDGENGVEIFHEWLAFGITILGDGVMPAVDGARLRALACSNEFNQIKIKAASYIENQNSGKGVKKTMLKLTKDQKTKLADKFKPFGTVLSYSDNNDFVAVLRANNAVSMYPVDENTLEVGVLEKNFSDLAVKVCGKTTDAEGNSVEILMDGESLLTESIEKCTALSADIATNKADLEAKDQKIVDLESKIATLEKADSERKCNDVVEALKCLRDKTERNCEAEEKVPTEKFNALIECAKKGDFNASVDSDGKWNGIACASEKLDAMFAAQQRDYREKLNGSKNRAFAWDGNIVKGASGEYDPLDLAAKFANIATQ